MSTPTTVTIEEENPAPVGERAQLSGCIGGERSVDAAPAGEVEHDVLELDDYDYNVEFGENATGEVKNLFSDVSELQTLGGDKRLINDISVTLQKKKTLKQMNENPDQFASDNLPDYDPN